MICSICSWICLISRASARLHSLLVIIPHSSSPSYHFRQPYRTAFVTANFRQPNGNQSFPTFPKNPIFPILPRFPTFPIFPSLPIHLQKNNAKTERSELASGSLAFCRLQAGARCPLGQNYPPHLLLDLQDLLPFGREHWRGSARRALPPLAVKPYFHYVLLSKNKITRQRLCAIITVMSL